MKISQTLARRLALRAQGLDGAWTPPPGKEGAAQVVERLGYVQIDTISVVQRAHHHTLWVRCPDYHPAMLHELQAVDRRVYEYWSHAASYLPMRDYRFSLRRMRASAASPRTRAFLEGHGELVEGIRSRIRDEGPLGSSDFAAPPGVRRGTWWDWKPAKRALEVLFDIGELMVHERRNFERRYDLAERVLPSWVDTTEPSPEETARFMVRRVVRAQGASSLSHWSIRRAETTAAVEELIDAGEVVRLDVDGATFYALGEALDAVDREPPLGRLLHILSPFDNLVIWRGPLLKLFGFDCKLECYTPEAKRRYGYFCLPILWGDTFVGRVDAKAERKERVLRLRGLFFEPGFLDDGEVLPALAAKLHAFAAFNGCDRVVLEAADPEVMLEPVRDALAEPIGARSSTLKENPISVAKPSL